MDIEAKYSRESIEDCFLAYYYNNVIKKSKKKILEEHKPTNSLNKLEDKINISSYKKSPAVLHRNRRRFFVVRDKNSLDRRAGEFSLKRKLIFVLVILSVLFAGTAFAGNYAAGVAKRMKSARSVYDKILAKDNGCTLCDTRVAQSDYFVFLEKELNTVYKKVMALLPQKEKNRLRNEERKWIKTRDEHAEKNSAEFKGGTLESFECSRTLIEYDEQRLMYLAKYYDRVRSKK